MCVQFLISTSVRACLEYVIQTGLTSFGFWDSPAEGCHHDGEKGSLEYLIDIEDIGHGSQCA